MGSFCSTGDDTSPDAANQSARKPNAKPYSSVDHSVSEDSQMYEPSVTVGSTVLNAANSDPNASYSNNNNNHISPGIDNSSLKIMVTPPAEAAEGAGPDEEEYNKIKDDIRKRRDEAENLVEWKKVADFASILPTEAKQKLWQGVFKSQEDDTMVENKRISKVLRTFVMLHLTRQYKREKKEVPDDIRNKLPAITRNPSRFIGDFIKKSPSTHNNIFQSIYSELRTNLENDKKLKPEKLTKKLKQLQNNYDELTRQPISASFNETDFLKQAYLQYILYAYQRKMDEVN